MTRSRGEAGKYNDAVTDEKVLVWHLRGISFIISFGGLVNFSPLCVLLNTLQMTENVIRLGCEC